MTQILLRKKELAHKEHTSSGYSAALAAKNAARAQESLRATIKLVESRSSGGPTVQKVVRKVPYFG